MKKLFYSNRHIRATFRGTISAQNPLILAKAQGQD